MSRKLLLALTPLVLVLSLLGMPSAHAVVDKDCADFSTQKQAQIFYLKAGGPQSDPHRLDYDHDGVACETNPCPCYTGTQLPDGDDTSTGPTRVVQMARITRVVDGDTVKVRLTDTGRRRTVRMIGIDTPEMSRECGAGLATRSLEKLAPRGTKVKLVSDPTQDLEDRYGRILRYVTKRKDQRDLNRAQVYLGWAKVYVYGGNPFERTKSYRVAKQQAKDAPRGIWKRC